MTEERLAIPLWQWQQTYLPDPATLGLVRVAATRVEQLTAAYSRRMMEHWSFPGDVLVPLCNALMSVIPATAEMHLRPCRACLRSRKLYDRWLEVEDAGHA